jgi:hypothetical protein
MRAVTLLLVLVPSVLAAAASSPTGSGDPSRDPVLEGRRSFEMFCVNCHGESARGDGELADLLRIITPDLTRLSARNGGDFPADEVRRRIDGTHEVRGHGDRMMPVWGMALDPRHGEGDGESYERAQHQIDAIVEYLGSIQEDD